jgi:hypothetical protein
MGRNASMRMCPPVPKAVIPPFAPPDDESEAIVLSVNFPEDHERRSLRGTASIPDAIHPPLSKSHCHIRNL